MTIPSTATRLAALLTVNFLLVYTGFGLFAGIITPCFFAVDCLRSRERSVHLVALVAALLSGASFFLGYTVDPADDFELTSHAPASWP